MPADVPGTDYRIATISGTPEGCQRARKWVDDLVAEVREVPISQTPVCGVHFVDWYFC